MFKRFKPNKEKIAFEQGVGSHGMAYVFRKYNELYNPQHPWARISFHPFYLLIQIFSLVRLISDFFMRMPLIKHFSKKIQRRFSILDRILLKLTSLPIPAFILTGIAALLLAKKQFESAALILRKINVGCRHPRFYALYSEAYAWRFVGATRNSAEIFQRCVARNSEDIEIPILLYHLYNGSREYHAGADALASIDTMVGIALAAVLLNAAQDRSGALKLLTAYAKRSPENAEAVGDYMLWNMNCYHEAIAIYEIALGSSPRQSLLLKHALAVPMIPTSPEALKSNHDDIIAKLNALLESPPTLCSDEYFDTVAYSTISVSYTWLDNLYPLVFHGTNNLNIMKTRAKVFQKVFDDIAITAPHIRPQLATGNARIKFGFIVEYAWPDVWKFWGNMLDKLSRDSFDVSVFVPKDLPNSIVRFIGRFCDRIIEFPSMERTLLIPIREKSELGAKSFKMARNIVGEAGLDVLYSPSIGQSPLAQYLSYSRLAPLQMVDGGRLTTTGMPEIDYYLMNVGRFFADPADHFSERLALLRGEGSFFFDEVVRDVPPDRLTRRDLKWPRSARIYLSMQELTNRHPEMDLLIANIMKRDKTAFFVLTNRVGGYAPWHDLVKNLRDLGVRNASRRIMPSPACNERPAGFRNAMLNLADNCISYRCMGGGTTFYQLLAAGIPQIIWPSDNYAGSICGGLYYCMGLTDLLVDNADDYIALNIRLAKDDKWRTAMRNKLKRAVKAHFNAMKRFDGSNELSSFVKDACMRKRAGLPLDHWYNGTFYKTLTAAQLREFARESGMSSHVEVYDYKTV